MILHPTATTDIEARREKMKHAKIKVLIADDHTLVRKGLKNILDTPSDIQVAGEAANSDEVFYSLKKSSFDAMVLDISMPGKTGLEILPEIKKNYPHLPVLIFSAYGTESLVKRAFEAGAAAFLQKGCEPKELIQAVRKVVHENHAAF
jgi:two-component system invasion response regulator UvrY